MLQELLNKSKSMSVIGLGYVGLPLALEFAKHFKVIGFDVSEERVAMMQKGIDPSKELSKSKFEGCDIEFTSDYKKLKEAHFHIVCVPTYVDKHKVPDLKPLLRASESVGQALKKGDIVVYESTVYPGCTEDDCLPILENKSNLKAGIEFKYGYSPERINPGDKKNTLTKILKIVSANDNESLEIISAIYGHIIEGGIYETSSIKVAEAAKVIENTQRDINISLMNELAIICDKMNIDTNEVIDAASTKWNFHTYRPGLVGGHCIGVDPYYLMHKSKQLGHDPQVIAAGRRINDRMPSFVAKKMAQSLIEKGKNPGTSRVLVMGVTFKENVSDIRNSKVVDLVKELLDYSIEVDIVDAYASSSEFYQSTKLILSDEPKGKYDGIIVAVGHREYRDLNIEYFQFIANKNLILFDLKGIYKESVGVNYWRL